MRIHISTEKKKKTKKKGCKIGKCRYPTYLICNVLRLTCVEWNIVAPKNDLLTENPSHFLEQVARYINSVSVGERRWGNAWSRRAAEDYWQQQKWDLTRCGYVIVSSNDHNNFTKGKRLIDELYCVLIDILTCNHFILILLLRTLRTA